MSQCHNLSVAVVVVVVVVGHGGGVAEEIKENLLMYNLQCCLLDLKTNMLPLIQKHPCNRSTN